MPLGPVEQTSPIEITRLVSVKAEVPMDAAGLVLGLQVEDRHQAEEAYGRGSDEDPFHGEQALAGVSGLLQNTAAVLFPQIEI